MLFHLFDYSDCTLIKTDWHKMHLMDSVESMKVRYYGLNYQTGNFELTAEYENTDYKFNSNGFIEEEIGYLSIKYVDTNKVLVPYRTINKTYKDILIDKKTVFDHESNKQYSSSYIYNQNKLLEQIDSDKNEIVRKTKFDYKKGDSFLMITEDIEERTKGTTQYLKIQSKYNDNCELLERKEFLNNNLQTIEIWEREVNGYSYDLTKKGAIIRKESYDSKSGEKINSWFYNGLLNSEKHIFYDGNRIMKRYTSKNDNREPDIYTYDYVYDEQGNIIERIKYLNGTKVLIETREIEYY